MFAQIALAATIALAPVSGGQPDTCLGDELCFTLESEAKAYDLMEAYDVPSTFALPTETIYLGYYSTLPALEPYEGYVRDPQTDTYYVFAVFPDPTTLEA